LKLVSYDVSNDHDSQADTQESGLDKIAYQEIIEAIRQLSPVYRTVFNLFVIEGYSHDEIAQQLKISVGASKSNLSKARQNLRKLIKEKKSINVMHSFDDDKELDQISRSAAEAFEAPSPADWDKMQRVLDRELPQQEKRRRGIFWWIIPAVIATAGLFYWQTKHVASSESILKTAPAANNFLPKEKETKQTLTIKQVEAPKALAAVSKKQSIK